MLNLQKILQSRADLSTDYIQPSLDKDYQARCDWKFRRFSSNQ